MSFLTNSISLQDHFELIIKVGDRLSILMNSEWEIQAQYFTSCWLEVVASRACALWSEEVRCHLSKRRHTHCDTLQPITHARKLSTYYMLTQHGYLGCLHPRHSILFLVVTPRLCTPVTTQCIQSAHKSEHTTDPPFCRAAFNTYVPGLS